MPGDYGPPIDGQAEMSEIYWRDVESCLRLRHTPRAFPVMLHRWQVREDGPLYFLWDGRRVAGYYERGKAIHVFGDPVYSREWRHEMPHHLFREATGDSDHGPPQTRVARLRPHAPRALMAAAIFRPSSMTVIVGPASPTMTRVGP